MKSKSGSSGTTKKIEVGKGVLIAEESPLSSTRLVGRPEPCSAVRPKTAGAGH